MSEAKWTRKDLLGLRDLTAEELQLILETAKSFHEVSLRTVKKVPALRGKTVANLFFEPSTRTRISFELAENLFGPRGGNVLADIISPNGKAARFLFLGQLRRVGRMSP